jgi:hypothetical protein
MKLIGTLIGLAGIGWLAYIDWHMAVGVTAVMFGDNLARR